MSKRTPEQIANLQNLIKANRESEKRFDMDYYGKEESCGTSCCVLGNYAMRPDLQSEFTLKFPPDKSRDVSAQLWHIPDDRGKGLYSTSIQKHFGLTMDECDNLFAIGGSLDRVCSSARDAADFIEKYIGEQE